LKSENVVESLAGVLLKVGISKNNMTHACNSFKKLLFSKLKVATH